jgi:Mrp family chromosome partitioning ATPase/capsular polysaccharide biosynthesis protein
VTFAGETSRVPTLRGYVRVCRRRKWIIVAAALLPTIAAVLLSLGHEHRYRGEAKVLIGIGQAPLGANQRVEPERLSTTSADLAEAPAVAQRTLAAAGVRDRTPADFLDQAKVVANPDDDLLVFHVTDPDPALAVRLTNEHARQFIAYRDSLDRGIYARQVGNAFLVAPAVRATVVDKGPVKNGVLGLAAGLLVGVLLAFAVEGFDPRVHSSREIGERLRLPLLARLPAPPAKLPVKGAVATRGGPIRRHAAAFRALAEPARSARKATLVMQADPHHPEAEAFRVLATNFEFFNLEVGARVVLFTSSGHSEGKSTTVANLAVALARRGRRVIAVDLDVRHGSLARLFGLERGHGVTDVAAGRLALDTALVTVPVENGAPSNGDDLDATDDKLHVLPSGSRLPDLDEFMGRPVIGDVLARLEERADIVLIDSPPLLGVDGAVSLVGQVDAVIVLARLGMVRAAALDEARRVLWRCPAHKLGFIATGADAEDIEDPHPPVDLSPVPAWDEDQRLRS